ncbi:MAG: ABC transporter permease, partial [Acidothermaceae bacterium]
MSAQTATVTSSRHSVDGGTATGSTLARAMHSEWTKLFSVRSTGWTLLALVASTIGFGILACWGTNHGWPQMSPTDRANFDPVATSMSGMAFGQL